MAARRPLYNDGNDLREMSSSMITAIQNRCIYVYGGNPSVTLTQVSSGGSLDSMSDTRLQAGAAASRADRFPTEGETAEPSTVTVVFDRINQVNASLSAPTDTNNKLYPVYYDGSNIQAMNSNTLPEIKSAWNRCLIEVCINAYEESLTHFKNTFQNEMNTSNIHSMPQYQKNAMKYFYHLYLF